MRARFAVAALVCTVLLAALAMVPARAQPLPPDCVTWRCLYLPAVEHNIVPTETPTTTPVPTAVPPTLGLIINGNFELGRNVGWIETSDFPYDLVTTEFPPGLALHSGVWGTWLGGDYDGTTAIIEQVTIDASKHYLSYWHWIASSDICYEDVGGVALLNDDGVVTNDEIVDAYLLCDETNTGKWVRRSIDVRQFAGQTRLLFILAGTDFSLNSNLFIDDVSFEREKITEADAPGVESSEDIFIARDGEVKPADPSSKGAGRKIDAPSRVRELLEQLSK